VKQDKPAQADKLTPNENALVEKSVNGVMTYPAGTSIEPMLEIDENFKAPDELLQAQSLANLLDTLVKLPFINFRVGLDFLIGLIPGIGDSVMLIASLRVIYLGHKLGVPNALKYKMVRNSLIDYCLGFVPILGDIVDLFFKANVRNVRIIEAWWVAENKTQIDALAKRQLDAWHKQQDEQDT
jgi:hypothetical protein